MKKSDKNFSVTINGVTTKVGTRSGVANFVRGALENAEAGTTITFGVNVEAVPVETPEKTETAAS